MSSGDTAITNRGDKLSSGFRSQLLNTGHGNDGFLIDVPADLEAKRWSQTYFNNQLNYEDYSSVEWKTTQYITQFAVTAMSTPGDANVEVTAPGHAFLNDTIVRFIDIAPGTLQTELNDDPKSEGGSGFTTGNWIVVNTNIAAGTFELADSEDVEVDWSSDGYVYIPNVQSDVNGGIIGEYGRNGGTIGNAATMTFYGNTIAEGGFDARTGCTGGSEISQRGTGHGLHNPMGSTSVLNAATSDRDGPRTLITPSTNTRITWEWMYYWTSFRLSAGTTFKLHFGVRAGLSDMGTAIGALPIESPQTFDANGNFLANNGMWFTADTGVDGSVPGTRPLSMWFHGKKDGVTTVVDLGMSHDAGRWYRSGFSLTLGPPDPDILAAGGVDRFDATSATKTVLQAYDNNQKIGDPIIDGAPYGRNSYFPFLALTTNDSDSTDWFIYIGSQYMWASQNRGMRSGDFQY